MPTTTPAGDSLFPTRRIARSGFRNDGSGEHRTSTASAIAPAAPGPPSRTRIFGRCSSARSPRTSVRGCRTWCCPRTSTNGPARPRSSPCWCSRSSVHCCCWRSLEACIADRFDRRNWLIAMQSVQLVFSAALAPLASHDSAIWALFVVQLGVGIGNALNAPAWAAALPTLVHRQDLSGAISLNSINDQRFARGRPDHRRRAEPARRRRPRSSSSSTR